MLRGALFSFVAGWLLWFWLDKNPYLLGPMPPAVDGEYVSNFQHTVDLLKAGRIKAAYVYVWQAHFVLLSLAVGLVIGMIFGSVSRILARKKWIKLYVPARKAHAQGEAEQAGKGD